MKALLRLRITCYTDVCSVYRMLMIGVETPMQNGCKFESLSEKYTMGETAFNWWNIASLSLGYYFPNRPKRLHNNKKVIGTFRMCLGES